MSQTRSKKSNDKNIAIIGARSFKGFRLLQYLTQSKNSYKTIAIDIKKPKNLAQKIKFFQVDLTDTLADDQLAEIFKKEKIDIVIHCAIRSRPPKRLALAHEIISVGTMYILNACAEAKVKKMILASTTDVYGAYPENPNFLQEDIHQPRGDKLSSFLKDIIDAEKQTLRYAKKNPSAVVTILRPCTILGPTASSFKTDILQRFFVPTVLGFDPLFQFIHEDDVLDSLIKCIKEDHPGIYNIVGDGVLPLSKILQIAGKLNFKLPQTGFKTMVGFLWFLDLVPAPPSHVNFMRYLCVADGTKAKEKMDFHPQYTSKESLVSFIKAERLRELNLLIDHHEEKN